MSRKSFIDYEQLVQTALRSVVRDALSYAAKNGLPGNHHFYIAFATDYPGVDIPDYLKEQYPEEITIVLQHEFWDLVIEDTRFSITLCFNDIHERLMIPFDAIVSFVDPSVKFGLQFAPEFDEAEETAPAQKPTKAEKSKKEPAPKEEDGDGSNVVTLDSFRRK